MRNGVSAHRLEPWGASNNFGGEASWDFSRKKKNKNCLQILSCRRCSRKNKQNKSKTRAESREDFLSKMTTSCIRSCYSRRTCSTFLSGHGYGLSATASSITLCSSLRIIGRFLHHPETQWIPFSAGIPAIFSDLTTHHTESTGLRTNTSRECVAALRGVSYSQSMRSFVLLVRASVSKDSDARFLCKEKNRNTNRGTS